MTDSYAANDPAEITPLPSIHNRPAADTTPNTTALDALTQKTLAQALLSGIASAIVGALTGLVTDAKDAIAALEAFGEEVLNGVEDIAQLIEKLGVQTIDDVVNLIKGIITDVENVVVSIENIGETILVDVENLPIISTILHLLGINTGGGTGNTGGTTTTTTNSGATASAPLTLTQFLGLLDTNTQITTAQLQALAPAATSNVLADAAFSVGGADIQGQGLWVWDGMTDSDGSIRTVRPGLITVYVAVGTPGGVFPSGFNTGDLLAYLQSTDQSYLADGFMFTGLDESHFEVIYVPYFTAGATLSACVTAGINWLVGTINSIPGPFILVGNAQGTLVMSGVYDQIRYGSLTSRSNDLLAGVMWGNMRREEGHAFPGYAPPAGTSGCVVDVPSAVGPYTAAANPSSPAGGNLVDTENKWWDLVAPGDYLSCCPVTGTTTPLAAAPFSLTNPPGPNTPMEEEVTAVIDEIMRVSMTQTGVAPGVTIGIAGPMGYYYNSYGSGMYTDGYYRIDSVTKTFTAVAILQAVGAGLLSLNDTLEQYVPGVANGDTITIQHMLMMRSGVYDYTQNQLFQLNLVLGTDGSFTPDTLLSLIKAGAPRFAPGTSYEYTDSNFVLLGYVLQAVHGGQDAETIITNNVITPAGLTQTTWPAPGDQPLPAPADVGYVPMILDYLGLSSGITPQTSANTYGTLWTSGALVSTVSDMVKWGQTGLGNTLLTPEMQQLRMTTFEVYPWPGEPVATTGYGLGFIQVGSWFGHDGSWPAFDGVVLFEPVTGTTIVVAENYQTSAPVALDAIGLYWYNLASYLLPGSTQFSGYSPGSREGALSLVDGYAFRAFWHQAMQTYTGNMAAVLADAEKNSTATAAQLTQCETLQNYYMNSVQSPQSAYYFGQPLLAKGDGRSYVQIGLDYINSFVGGVHPDGTQIKDPPVSGVRHQILGQRVAVQPGQVVIAGASTRWVNVQGTGDQILVCVNAYDAQGNLLATIGDSAVSPDATVTDPLPSSSWEWVQLKDDFVMPPNAATACIVFDVEPAAATTGMVWFKKAIFEVTATIDGALINAATLSQITGQQVSGPQGIADMASAIQNMLDTYASASSGSAMSGVAWAQALQTLATEVSNAQLAYTLGVNNGQILSPSNTPLYNGLQPTGEVTFPLTTFPTGSTWPTVSIAAGTSLIGFIRCQQAVSKGFIEFAGYGSTNGSTGVYVNVYSVNATTGNYTLLWASSDISDQISGSLAWIAVNIPQADAIKVGTSEIVALEIVAEGSTISVAALVTGTPNNPSTIPPNVGAARTLSSTGGTSPASLTPSDVTYGGTEPFVCFGISASTVLYQAPVTTAYNANGWYKYPIPSWVVNGDLLYLVGCGAGAAGGAFDGTLFAPNNGQGATAGEWETDTVVYGTNVPAGTTELDVYVGAGPHAGSADGATSIVGYNFDTPPAFDATGAGAAAYGTTLSASHTAAADAYVVVALNTGFGTFNVTYGGVRMQPLGLVYNGDAGAGGATALYGLADVPGGASTITATFGASCYATLESISFTGVSSAALVTSAYGTSSALAHTVACAANQVIVQAFGTHVAHMSAFNGGTNKFYNYTQVASGGATYFFQGLSLSYATGAGANFAATGNVADDWGSIAVALNPSGTALLTCAGGAAGGPGGASNFNPANGNTTSNGLGPGDESWAGGIYKGGPTTTTSGVPGNAPGGGSAGGNSNSPFAFPGADGTVRITAAQSATSTGGLMSGGGGGSELSVVYEATGTGSYEATAGALSTSWTHDSAGGANCAVVLVGVVEYSNGAATLDGSYGNLSFTVGLDGVTYYNASGTALYVFALGLIGPPSGEQTVTLSAGSATINALCGNTVSYQNVGSFGNGYSSSGDSANMSLSGISAAAGQMVVGAFASQGGTMSSYNQTLRWGAYPTSLLIGDAPGAASVNFTASVGAQYWGAVGGILIPVS